MLEVYLGRAHQNDGLCVLLLHEEGQSFCQLEQLVRGFGLYFGQQGSFEVGEGLVEIALSHAGYCALGNRLAEYFGTAVFGQQLVVKHYRLLLPSTSVHHLGFEQTALRGRAGKCSF